MNKKFDIISMILIVALTIILIAFVFNYFTKSNETTPTNTDIPFENIHIDVPTVSGSNPFVSSTPLENDKEALNYIKSKLPDAYICNLDGKVIVSNKE